MSALNKIYPYRLRTWKNFLRNFAYFTMVFVAFPLLVFHRNIELTAISLVISFILIIIAKHLDWIMMKFFH